MRMSEGIGEIAKALVSFQGNVQTLKKSNVVRGKKYSYKYISLDEIIEAVRRPLAEQGLAFFQSVVSEGDRIGVRTLLMHSSGEFIESDVLFLPGMNANAQDAGGAITYAKRYALTAALGLAADDDDDAQQVTQQQREQQQGHQYPSRHHHQPQQQQPERSAAFQVDNKITDKQMKALKTSLNMQAKKNGEDMERIWQIAAKSCDIAGKSTKELSRQEASRVLDFLNGPRKTEQR